MSRSWAAPRAVVLLATVLTAACSGGAAGQQSTPTPIAGPTTAVPSTTVPFTTVPTTTVPSTTTAVSPTTTAPPRAVTIAFGGDVYGQPPVREALAQGRNPLRAVAPPLQSADVAVVNLETAVGHTGAPRDKQFVFQADPALLVALREAGVDAVSVANNHSFDFGLDGFLETLGNVDAAGLRAFGGGHDAASAYAPAVIDAGGVKIALVGIAVIGPEDEDRAEGGRPGTTNGRDRTATLDAIKAAKKLTPIVIVMVHWGAELASCPRPFERDLAARMLAAGASAVVGAHPHVLQGITAGDGQLIAYSLGNFVFFGGSDATRETGVLTLTIAPDGAVVSHTFDPARIDGAATPVPLNGPERDAALDALAALDPAACRAAP
jgi:poly-gamma-glutamate synthesis protein (capsule biosynthesis protein)